MEDGTKGRVPGLWAVLIFAQALAQDDLRKTGHTGAQGSLSVASLSD